MKKIIFILFALSIVMSIRAVDNRSIYTQRPSDTEAYYFTAESYNIKADGKTDVTEALQQAINQVKKEKNFGILFIPEGKYLISKTIYVPKAIRLIGYGSKRPEIILKKNAPGYQAEVSTDKGKANYMLWFTDNMVDDVSNIRDAGAGTFYSALSNINLRIEDGNPHAVALRTHFAQHSFISHACIYIGKGKAGLYDVGNEMENVAFYGGEYGIYTTKCSPGWQMMMVDSYFEGQRKAAIHCQEVGFTIVNLQAKNVPAVVDITPNYHERLFMENCRFEDVKGPAIVVSNENNGNNQITLRNVDCRNVPVLVKYRRSETETAVPHKIYNVRNYAHGLQMDDMTSHPEYRTLSDIVPLTKMPEAMVRDIPALPAMESWVNVKDLGAKGDGVADDTKAFQEAIDKHEVIYVPQGWYRFTETVRMKPSTKLIGLHPFGTQFILEESTPAFSGFGAPKALLESSEGGENILNGIGMNTGGYNYRAVGLKWMANARSYVNDVKFVGGHGGMEKGPVTLRQYNWGERKTSSPSAPVYNMGMDQAWDNQYWSFWVTKNGGGTIKDIWTASIYATSGLYVNNTSTAGRIYAMSLEHHVRNEARFKNVSNWKVYAFQLEEESRESSECQPVELEGCKDMTFANLYMFRVIRVNVPYHNSVRTWNCENVEFLNVHNYSQIKYTTDLPIYDINTDIEVRPWEFQRLLITGKEPRRNPLANKAGVAEQLASGFEFTEGIASDSKGNVYFSENKMRRIYKWNAETNRLSMVADFPWKPIALACDTKDNLLVLFRYDPQPGYLVDGKQEAIPTLPDAHGTSFSGWGNSGFGSWVYAIDPENPEETIKLLPKVPMGQIKQVKKALYPSNRWRDFHDFNTVSVWVPEMCFVAPDQVTIIPECYDLARTSSLLEAYPGKPFYAADEYDKRMVKMDVSADGKLSNLQYFAERGEFGSAVDAQGNVYVADGQIYIYDKDGKEKGMIEVPERPSTITFGGKDGKTLFVTGRSKFFRIPGAAQ
ncbi:sugar lactone lactonase YvrE [Parabacteroides sp. PF5-5]|uniref:glycosyl hydrolase family 28-related protein n=1 Tax=unclassified Parabacteroides TaxID=2649774 RepID=UPI0024770B02|nr:MULTISPECIES: glycosyl hydrolase family 28-related protein [unclassified Parabacteroides]MDH6305728.1 sugar lactone lactonase YvrE [Parabacteroides sp. PH5-39]MDH6316800.1 sugar lactone lactonase YvrE [Parabacteroides sp. PF5-13]MDH6320441.1 sugar lactone lactonase YvrE [Parabacteroides sp. PH5-13]MDH6324171.1 sugar lactone lactonase YvrE [Parabacteroides sp. PH5-8]MDH6327986.1 sugar lactone lactonase YvrE [Parabacteroides sp. PH5-41]